VLNLLLITGIIVWCAVAVSRLTRRIWPVRRVIPPLMRAELMLGVASLLLLVAAGPAHLPRDAATGFLSAAMSCGLLAAGTTAWRRYRNAMPVVRLRRSSIPASHLYIWVDTLCASVAAIAPPLLLAVPGSALADAIGGFTGAGVIGLIAGIKQRAQLRRRNRADTRASLRTAP
jgi:hypothetical protein